MNLLVRQETILDFPEVYAINTLAFEQENEAELVNALRNSQTFIPELSLVAIHENKIVGHILFTLINIKDDNDNYYASLALAPLAVIPQFQHKGVGGQLIKSGLAKAKALGYKSAIVLGHENYYPKFGFVPAEKWQIKAPFDVPTNVFMGIELVQYGLKNVSGTVIYPREFESV